MTGLLALCSLGLALAAEPESTGVVEALPGGSIDWTRLVMTVTVQSDQRVGAWMDRRLQEQDAMDRLGPQVRLLADRVRVTPDTLVADVLAGEGDLARRVGDALSGWEVVEARYHEAGAVELSAELDLRRSLKPVLTSLATTEAPPKGEGEATGLLIDARGLPFEPCLVPRVITSTGTVLFGAQRLSADGIEYEAPVVYVTDPADARAVRRAGERPILVRAASVVRGGELMLDPEAGRRVEESSDLASIAAGGRVVVVVGP